MRPEHLTIAEDAGGQPSLQATVTAVENLGSEEIALCAVGEAKVSMRGSRPLGLHAGDHVTLTAPVERLHLFDRDSGNRLAWRPASAEATPAAAARRRTVETASA